jgi:hypothetical protein
MVFLNILGALALALVGVNAAQDIEAGKQAVAEQQQAVEMAQETPAFPRVLQDYDG